MDVKCLLNRYLDATLRGDDAVHRRFGERVKLTVVSSHEIRLEEVPAVSVVFKLALKTKQS
jgi:hypothetical protein